MFAIQNIVVPTDFSEHSAKAVEAAFMLAKKHDATVSLIYVFVPLALALPADTIVDGTDFYAQASSKLEAELKAEQKRLAEKGLKNVSAKFVSGIPHVEINAFAKDQKADLIIMGSHGRTGVAHAVLGSVAEKVVRTASCPVLVIKTDHKK